MFRGFAALVIITALVVPLVGCDTSTQAIDMRRWVPEQAITVATFDIERARADEDIARLWNWLASQPDMVEGIEDFSIVFGENPKEVLLFASENVASAQSIYEAGYTGLVIRGDHDEREMIEYLESDGMHDFEIEKRKGQKVYADDSEDFGVAFVARNLYLFGDLRAVRDSIDVAKTGEGRVSAELTNALKTRGDALFKMVMTITPEMRAQIRDELEYSQGDAMSVQLPGLEALAEMKSYLAIIDKQGDVVSEEVDVVFTSAKHAEAAGGLFDTLLVFFQFVPEDQGIPEELLAMLDSIEITTKGALLRITLDTTVSEIETLIQALEAYDPYEYYEEEEVSPEYWSG